MANFVFEIRTLITASVLSAGFVLLAACDESDKRAEKHFHIAQQFISDGQIDQALAELIMVFQLKPEHKDARLAFAKIERARGNIDSAFDNYVKLVEYYPDLVEGRRALAEIAFFDARWDALIRHASAAAQLAPNDLQIKSLLNGASFYTGIETRNQVQREAAIDIARSLLSENQNLLSSRKILIDDAIKNGDFDIARAEIDLAQDPNGLWPKLAYVRKEILQRQADFGELEHHLESMISQFPDDGTLKNELADIYVRHNKTAKAEELLRSQAFNNLDELDSASTYFEFLRKFRGPNIAIQAVDEMQRSGGLHLIQYARIRSEILMEMGYEAQAIAELQLVTNSAPRTAEIRDVVVDLATILAQAGNRAEAWMLVERVLSEDRSHVGAIILKSGWLIDDAKVEEALVLINDGLRDSPNNSRLLLQMAHGYAQQGLFDLEGEMLARAMEASGGDVNETLRYARFLLRESKLTAAETVLQTSLTTAHNDIRLLEALADTYIAKGDWVNIRSLTHMLDGIESDDAELLKDQLEKLTISENQKVSALLALLEELSGEPTIDFKSEVALVRSALIRNGVVAALELSKNLSTKSETTAALEIVEALTFQLDDKYDQAERIYAKLIENFPEIEYFWMTFYRLKMKTGDMSSARTILDRAIKAIPNGKQVLRAKANQLEADGKFDAAIATYERLYAEDPSSRDVANNLATLLSTYKTDDGSLNRAYDLARWLRGSDNPLHQGTYGWIAYRRGFANIAIGYLEPAVANLPNDPRLQYYLAKVYMALEYNEKAIAGFQKTLALTDPENPPDFLRDAEIELDQLSETKNSP